LLKRSLGNLNYLRIWHDNSGKGGWASWFLKYIIVHDVQTRQKFYFICQRWLAVEKDDGSIDRVLAVCGDAQKNEIKYLLAKESKNKMTDDHLWFSIFFRPAHSSFTRVQRVTCCFVLLFLSMLMNIIYYGQGGSSNHADGLQIGPFYLTTEQVDIVFFSNFLPITCSQCSLARNTESTIFCVMLMQEYQFELYRPHRLGFFISLKFYQTNGCKTAKTIGCARL
jgi:polycystin 1L2